MDGHTYSTYQILEHSLSVGTQGYWYWMKLGRKCKDCRAIFTFKKNLLVTGIQHYSDLAPQNTSQNANLHYSKIFLVKKNFNYITTVDVWKHALV